jgi:hypothetical protein
MAGLVPAIHVLLQRRKEDVDGRHDAGHDAERADARQFAVSRGCAMFKPDSRGSSPAMTAETEAPLFCIHSTEICFWSHHACPTQCQTHSLT